jgi:hypothetical protein
MKSLSKYIFGPNFQKGHIVLIVVSFLFMVWSPASVAEEAHDGATHSLYRHHAALFIGNTQNDGSKHGLSLAMDYEYRITERLGLGGLVEYAGGDFEHYIVAIPLFIHPYGNWCLLLAAGTEIHNDNEKNNKREEDWLVRTGVGYRFHFGEKYSISPEFNVDFSEHETLFIYGVSIGIGF